MSKEKPDYSLKERLMVVTILFLLAVIAIQNLVLSLKISEEQTAKTATVEYAAVRNMYTAQNHDSTIVSSLRFADGGTLSNHSPSPLIH